MSLTYSAFQAKAIAQHIDYVIGMSQEIGDRAAIEFAVGFYDALGAGKSVEFAHKLGCFVNGKIFVARLVIRYKHFVNFYNFLIKFFA